MKHAGPQALSQLGDLLAAVRTLPGWVERRPGVFYRRGKACLHFHEDAAGLFGDFRSAADWERFPVGTPAQRKALLERLKAD